VGPSAVGVPVVGPSAVGATVVGPSAVGEAVMGLSAVGLSAVSSSRGTAVGVANYNDIIINHLEFESPVPPLQIILITLNLNPPVPPRQYPHDWLYSIKMDAGRGGMMEMQRGRVQREWWGGSGAFFCLCAR